MNINLNFSCIYVVIKLIKYIYIYLWIVFDVLSKVDDINWINNNLLGGKSYNFQRVEIYNESKLHFYRVDRQQMGVYMCIASNDVPPTVSKRVTLEVNCEFLFLSI